jgi:nicotinamide riboside transporter PnuC
MELSQSHLKCIDLVAHITGDFAAQLMMKKMTWAYLFTHFGYNDSIKKIAILF